MFRCKVLRPLASLFVSIRMHSIGIFFISGRKCVNLVVIFNKGRRKTFVLPLKNCKSCICIKYLILSQPLKLMALNFTMFLYSLQNPHNSRIAKNLFLLKYFEQTKLCLLLFLFKQKFCHLKTCLCHVYVYAMDITWTVHLACSRASSMVRLMCIYSSVFKGCMGHF